MLGRGRGDPTKDRLSNRGPVTQSDRKRKETELALLSLPVNEEQPCESSPSPWDNEELEQEDLCRESPVVGNWDQIIPPDGVESLFVTRGCGFSVTRSLDKDDGGSVLGKRPSVPAPPAAARTRKVQRRKAFGRFASSFDGSCNDDEARPSRLGKSEKNDVDSSWIVTGPMGGGPQVGTVIPSYGGHVAADIWKGLDRDMIRCFSRYSACLKLTENFRALRVPVQNRIRQTGLSHLPAIMFQYLDMPLISAFIERWQPDTNSFHMPFGEMTIMLHDVKCILDIPIDGGVVGCDWSAQSVLEGCAKLFGTDVETFRQEHLNGGSLDYRDFLDICDDENQSDDNQFSCYMLTLLSSTLFVDKTAVKVCLQPLAILADSTVDVARLSWGSATLAYLYRQLGIASRSNGRGMAGCCTLLQAWIYEYFPMFRQIESAQTADILGRVWRWHSGEMAGNNFTRLQTIRETLDALQADQIDWIPYENVECVQQVRTHFRGLIRYFDVVEAYMPDRVVRQVGYIQRVPGDPYFPDHASRPANSKKYSVSYSVNVQKEIWKLGAPWYFPDNSVFPLATTPSECTSDYLQWFSSISHPIIVSSDSSKLTSEYNATILSSIMDAMLPFSDTDIREIDDVHPQKWQPILSTLFNAYAMYKRGPAAGLTLRV